MRWFLRLDPKRAGFEERVFARSAGGMPMEWKNSSLGKRVFRGSDNSKFGQILAILVTWVSVNPNWVGLQMENSPFGMHTERLLATTHMIKSDKKQ